MRRRWAPALREAFDYFGGMPTEVLDNAKSIVSRQALRARQHGADQQPAVHAMGRRLSPTNGR
jgi:transposase